jgi:hypothetical protein
LPEAFAPDATIVAPEDRLGETGACYRLEHPKLAKKRHFEPKKGLLGLKKGQNRGFAVTDSSTGQKCKLLIYCRLQGIK